MFTVDDYGGSFIYDNDDIAVNELKKLLANVANEWMHIGVLLGVTFDWLKQRAQSPKQNLIETLSEWLKKSSKATLQQLVEAVEHKAGGSNPTVAKALKAALETMIQGKLGSPMFC